VVVLSVIRADAGGVTVTNPDRYEPMPGMAELPLWLWRRTSRACRIALCVLLVAGVAAAVLLAPRISDAKSDRAAADRREHAQQRARRAAALEAEQRPRSLRSSAASRTGMLDDAAGAIVADARARFRRGELSGAARRAECEPFPRTVGGLPPERDLRRRRGRYSCVAVTAEFADGVIGHPYRVLVDFATGRFTYCKISGTTGPERDPLVTTPRACGGS
jgi:hypothetical protein